MEVNFVKIGVRYFVKDARIAETDENHYSTTFTDYEAAWKIQNIINSD